MMNKLNEQISNIEIGCFKSSLRHGAHLCERISGEAPKFLKDIMKMAGRARTLKQQHVLKLKPSQTS